MKKFLNLNLYYKLFRMFLGLDASGPYPDFFQNAKAIRASSVINIDFVTVLIVKGGFFGAF